MSLAAGSEKLRVRGTSDFLLLGGLVHTWGIFYGNGYTDDEFILVQEYTRLLAFTGRYCRRRV